MFRECESGSLSYNYKYKLLERWHTPGGNVNVLNTVQVPQEKMHTYKGLKKT